MVATAALVGGCAGSPREGGFDSPVPAARIEAVSDALAAWRAQPSEHREIPAATRMNLVECLRSDDPLVRFYTIEALAEMTGERRGYRFDDPRGVRLAAVNAWQAWAEGGTA